MNPNDEISDEEFVPFLHGLSVDTYNKSFEWILNDPNFARVLRWMYKNLDHNNALTAREEYRYIELEKKNCLLFPEDLESSIAKIKEKYLGICMPGDHETLEEVELDVGMQEERLNVLERQETVVKDLIKQNEQIKEELTIELNKLSAAHHQCLEDEGTLADECTGLALDLETITDEVIEVIAENLEVYASCKGDKEIANVFFTFAPVESYRQTQALFRSHVDLYVSKSVVSEHNNATNEELRTTLVKARNMEERLSDAVFAYLDSKAELSSEQAKLALVSNYNDVHPSQIQSILIETRSAIDILKQEEFILEQEMQNAVEQFVQSCTSLAVNTAKAASYRIRQRTLNSLTHLVDMWQQAYSLDRVLYLCLRHELRSLEEFVQFATQLSQYVNMENSAIASRMASMNEICAEQESCEAKLQLSDQLLNVMFAMLGAPAGDGSILVKLYNDLQACLKELKDSADEGRRRKEERLVEIKNTGKPLCSFIWDGCTKQPNCWDRAVAALSHTLAHDMAAIDKRVVEASSLFTTVKKSDKNNLRKLWQWFLTDPSRLQAAFKNARSY